MHVFTFLSSISYPNRSNLGLEADTVSTFLHVHVLATIVNLSSLVANSYLLWPYVVCNSIDRLIAISVNQALDQKKLTA